MASNLATPGVFIEEKSSFGNSIVSVPTSVPAFVGYTEKAMRGTKSLLNLPTKINSIGQYIELFGGAPSTKFEITFNEEGSPLYNLNLIKSTRFLMYDSIRLYFSNGGSDCYIISVGDYSASITQNMLIGNDTGGGITSLEKYLEPTLLVVPDSILLPQNRCMTVQKEMLAHCGGKMKNRFAILDVYGGDTARTFDNNDLVTKFREGIGSNNLAWGAAYYPYLNTTIVTPSEIDYRRISNLEVLVEILNAEVDGNLESGSISASRAEGIKNEISRILDEDNDEENVASIQSTLTVISNVFNGIMADITDELNVLPPSPAMAGSYTMTDNTVNISKSPANISLGSVVSPAVNINNDNQEDLNLPLNGKAVNAIRSFTGKGTLVWGARTLEGNSQDYRYISVRRTMTFIEQSIKSSAEAYVFSPNNSTTWSTLRASVYNFLNNQWVSGVLVGASPDEAFDIQIGMGTTMTPNDILDGILKMTVKVAIVRPAEFIVLTFEQKQQQS